MNTNNEKFRLFKEMKEGYRTNNEAMLEHGARCWIALEDENPFTPDTPEFEAFFQMKKCYEIWNRGDVDKKINRRRMIRWTRELCKRNPKQPYQFDKEADKADKIAIAAENEAREKNQAELKAKEIELEAKRIVEEEIHKKKEAEEKERIRLEYEAEYKREQEERNKALEEAIARERAKLNTKPPEEDVSIEEQEQKNYVFGVVPEKTSWFKRLFFRNKNRG